VHLSGEGGKPEKNLMRVTSGLAEIWNKFLFNTSLMCCDNMNLHGTLSCTVSEYLMLPDNSTFQEVGHKQYFISQLSVGTYHRRS
jgi:hypothetical protein